MRNLIGLEMVCFCKSEHFELVYEGGYVSADKGEPIPDVMDMNCYRCTWSYFTRESDPVPFCPNCGDIERKRFTRREDLVDFLRGTDWTWTKRPGLEPIAVLTWEGEWQLLLTKQRGALEAQGKFREVRSL